MNDKMKVSEIRKIIREELRKKYSSVLTEGDISSLSGMAGETLKNLINSSNLIGNVVTHVDKMILLMQNSSEIEDAESVEYLAGLSKDVTGINNKLSNLKSDFAEMQKKLSLASRGDSKTTQVSSEEDVEESDEFTPESDGDGKKIKDPKIKPGQEILSDSES
jgi:hypothetical protein